MVNVSILSAARRSNALASPLETFSLFALACGALIATAGAVAAAAPPANDLAVHSFGEVGFRACALSTRGVGSPIDAFCATVDVPLDSREPDKAKLSLAVAWLKPLEKASAAADPVVILAGGPGQSARDLAAYLGRVFRDVRRNHHLIFIDQRGTGASNPLTCPENEARTPEDAAEALAACRATFAVDPRFFTTRQAVEDLELVRRRLGGPQFNLIGFSYGTRLAQEYARAHREGVRTMVLDGVVPPTLVLSKNFGRTLDTALQLSMSACTGELDAGCEVPLAALDVGLARLKAGGPQPVTFADPFTGELRTDIFDATDLMQFIHMGTYQPSFIAIFSQVFRDARAGRFDVLAAQRRMTRHSVDIAEGLHFAVACAEDAPLLTEADGVAEAPTRLGRTVFDTYRSVCRDWPRFEAPPERLTPLRTDVPTLLLSGAWDPVTPPDGAEQVAAHLSHAKHVVLQGQGHNASGVGCLPRVVAKFVEKGQVEGLDVKCVEKIRPLKPFISRTGWAP